MGHWKYIIYRRCPLRPICHVVHRSPPGDNIFVLSYIYVYNIITVRAWLLLFCFFFFCFICHLYCSIFIWFCSPLRAQWFGACSLVYLRQIAKGNGSCFIYVLIYFQYIARRTDSRRFLVLLLLYVNNRVVIELWLFWFYVSINLFEGWTGFTTGAWSCGVIEHLVTPKPKWASRQRLRLLGGFGPQTIWSS